MSGSAAMLDVSDHISLEQRLYYEARLLDAERYQEWLGLLTSDISYRMAIGGRRYRKDRSGDLPVGEGFSFDDDLGRLTLRIGRLESGLVWGEDPRNHVRRAVSNVEILRGEGADEATVYSVVTIHRSRLDGNERRLVGGREDLWRRTAGEWKLARRRVEFDHTIVDDTNLNVFF